MIPADVLKKIRALEIKTRQHVQNTFAGSYHSLFKGTGISFSEVREYQPGDDIRLIDWNVTARTDIPHIKQFEEERELTVLLVMDLSASQNFGSSGPNKAKIAAEIAATLGFSANQNNDRIGLILFSDQIETFIPPKKGKNHMFRILRDIFYLKAHSKKTSIKTALEYVTRVQKKKAIVFLISDFLDTQFEATLKTMSKKHELIPIILEDPRETSWPKSGILRLEDEETGDSIYINTSKKDINDTLTAMQYANQLQTKRLFNQLNITPIWIKTDTPYYKSLANYFSTRLAKK